MRLAGATLFVHMSDLHFVPLGELANGIDSLANARKVLQRIRGLSVPPAFILISGDLSNDGTAGSYEVLNGFLEEIGETGTPVVLALGNHDDRANFRRVVLGEGERVGNQVERYFSSKTLDGLRVIALDSMIPGDARGRLGEEQLAWLEGELRTPAPRGTLIMVHHCCRLAAPSHHYPMFILQDADALEAIVARHPGEVLGIFAGHSHQNNAAPFGGTTHMTAPAVLCQLDFFASDTYEPIPGSGFNLCQLADGQMVVNPVWVSGC
jgi:Icc protein